MGWYQDEYLQSEHWRQYAAAERRRTMHRCEKCGASGELHVHHLNYQHLGNEQAGIDTIVLCAQCHSLEHFPMRSWDEIRQWLTI